MVVLVSGNVIRGLKVATNLIHSLLFLGRKPIFHVKGKGEIYLAYRMHLN